MGACYGLTVREKLFLAHFAGLLLGGLLLLVLVLASIGSIRRVGLVVAVLVDLFGDAERLGHGGALCEEVRLTP